MNAIIALPAPFRGCTHIHITRVLRLLGVAVTLTAESAGKMVEGEYVVDEMTKVPPLSIEGEGYFAFCDAMIAAGREVDPELGVQFTDRDVCKALWAFMAPKLGIV